MIKKLTLIFLCLSISILISSCSGGSGGKSGKNSLQAIPAKSPPPKPHKIETCDAKFGEKICGQLYHFEFRYNTFGEYYSSMNVFFNQKKELNAVIEYFGTRDWWDTMRQIIPYHCNVTEASKVLKFQCKRIKDSKELTFEDKTMNQCFEGEIGKEKWDPIPDEFEVINENDKYIIKFDVFTYDGSNKYVDNINQDLIDPEKMTEELFLQRIEGRTRKKFCEAIKAQQEYVNYATS